MSELQDSELAERWREGMKKATSRARELAAVQKNKTWIVIADQMEGLCQMGLDLYRKSALSRREALRLVDQKQAILQHGLEAERAAKAQMAGTLH